MPPTGGETGHRNGRLIQQLFNWSDRDGAGIAFDSSTGFILPNGANRSPDASWIPIAKWNALTIEQKQKFLPLCPDFAIELLSHPPLIPPTRGDRGRLQAKMQEYLANGMVLGWLINPMQQQVAIYRQGNNVEVLNAPNSLSGESILSGFILDLQPIW